EVSEVPDPEDRALERALPRRDHATEVRAHPVADRVGVGRLRSADRGDGPVVVQTLAEHAEPERLRADLTRATEGGAHPVVDRVGGGRLRSADRGDGPVVVQTLAEQVEPERLRAV